ncbi:hypothetical protein [Nocardiopsis sp. NRRL B-16309]|uniref:hypothetical protein n=1 Tax=Nocardiopsis sp. NRRL B-16309 TaxID=1519494 RepID=UPI0006AE1D2A|nr:hypothetical protein [Nocardiopsis sp. NRRL B-16309]KOX18046.1 hypothetical protein ADL05_07990 [Nocardiopsis sp. NRRL B-16309]
MELMTVAALREALADLPDDAIVVASGSGRPLVAVGTDPGSGRVELTFPDDRLPTVNIIDGRSTGTVVQTDALYGDIHL